MQQPRHHHDGGVPWAPLPWRPAEAVGAVGGRDQGLGAARTALAWHLRFRRGRDVRLRRGGARSARGQHAHKLRPRHGAAARARLSKNLQHLMARVAAGRSSSACGAGVADQFALAAVFRDWQQPALSPQLPLGCRAEAEAVHVAANAVQPSFVVPRRTEAAPPSVTAGGAGDDVWAADVLELDGGGDPSAEKAFKVSSSVIVSSKFGAAPESFGLDGF
ncbi:hypothetical protein ZWY2020_040212 [Hordeum vulgare]|nr:hypothetical protein ZWY2020_040212 [Hordeum vulgare]